MTPSLTLRLDAYDRDAQRMIHAAQALADERKNPEVEPLHLLHRLLDRNDGTQALVRRAGVDPTDALLECEALVRRLPKADGVVAYFSPRLHDLLARAEGEAARDKAAGATNTHLLVALSQETVGPVAQVLKSTGLTSTLVRAALKGERQEAGKTTGAAAAPTGATAVDGDPTTYWATDDSVRNASIEIELDATKVFDRVVLSEPTVLGQRVSKFRISVPATPSDNNHRDWVTLAEGTTIGFKRIVRVPATKARFIRVEILDARACPCLSSVSVHATAEAK